MKRERPLGLELAWDEGLSLKGPRKKFRLKIGGKFLADGGHIGADDDLDNTFSDLQDFNADFRALRLTVSGTYDDFLRFKTEVEFAHIREVKDNWLEFRKIPFLGRLKLGHFKEPFSLDMLDSIDSIAFMERSLPTRSFAPSRDIGIMSQNTLLDERMTWEVGGFYVVGSVTNVQSPQDRIDQAQGTSLTARLTGLPWYADEGRRLLHLGLSYSHQFRDMSRSLIFKSPPESLLVEENLVSTGEFFSDGLDLINPELAMVLGPYFIQGEYFHVSSNADAAGDPQFWGFYLYGSYFITGEHRQYDKSNAVFSRVTPKRSFHPLAGEWGAWELGLRVSYVDLNDEAIKGGRELNLTAGLNWYLNPHIRFMFNYIRAVVEDKAALPGIDDGTATIIHSRFQLAARIGATLGE